MDKYYQALETIGEVETIKAWNNLDRLSEYIDVLISRKDPNLPTIAMTTNGIRVYNKYVLK